MDTAAQFIFVNRSSQLQAWLDLLTDDIRYRVLAPTVRALEAQEPAPEVVFMDEDKASLRPRVLQLTTPGYTIAENPPSLTRRFVTNIFVTRGAGAEQFAVRSNLLLYRSRGAGQAPFLFSAERHDTLQAAGGDLCRICSRPGRCTVHRRPPGCWLRLASPARACIRGTKMK